MIRNSAVVHNVHIYPNILVEKLICYPGDIFLRFLQSVLFKVYSSKHVKPHYCRISEMIDMLGLPIAMMAILPEEHFKIMKFFSKTFKVDCDIIKRLDNILMTISCGYPITINELDL